MQKSGIKYHILYKKTILTIYRKDFGLSMDKIEDLHRQVDTDLLPVIRAGESFDLDKVLDLFNVILQKI